MTAAVRVVRDVPLATLQSLLGQYGMTLCVQGEGETIAGSFWGDSEAGIIGLCVYVRDDTPIHSLLHEACHIICMTNERRVQLNRDAGGSDLEEASVCYLQIVLADQLDGIGRDLLMRDMDTWGYSFRLQSASRWFEADAEDALAWLVKHGLLSEAGRPTFMLRA